MPQPCSNPESLILVRLTLEMVTQMRRLYPASEYLFLEVEAQVRRGGEMLLEAGSIPRARAALEMIHGARSKLHDFAQDQTRLAA